MANPAELLPRGTTATIASRLTITVDGADAIGRAPVGTVDVPVVDLPWRPDWKDLREANRG